MAFVVGVIGSVATSGPAAGDVSGASEDVVAVLTLEEPIASFSASAKLTLDTEASISSGEIGLTVIPDGDAPGSLTYTIESASDSSSGDIVDVEAQGEVRIGIKAFDGCGSECTEELTITFERTDDQQEGDLGLTWSLDGFASADVEGTTGIIDFTIE